MANGLFQKPIAPFPRHAHAAGGEMDMRKIKYQLIDGQMTPEEVRLMTDYYTNGQFVNDDHQVIATRNAMIRRTVPLNSKHCCFWKYHVHLDYLDTSRPGEITVIFDCLIADSLLGELMSSGVYGEQTVRPMVVKINIPRGFHALFVGSRSVWLPGGTKVAYQSMTAKERYDLFEVTVCQQ